MTVILAIDPGSTSCGYAITVADGMRVRFISAGNVDAHLRAVTGLLAETDALAGNVVRVVLGIERPSGFVHDAFRGPSLLDTAYAAGGITWLARARAHEVVELSAGQCRKAVIGKATAGKGKTKGHMDALVKAALPGLVLDLPKQTNVHVRDALLLAIATNWLRKK